MATKRVLSGFLFFLFASTPDGLVYGVVAEVSEESVVMILASSQRPDFDSPWRRKNGGMVRHLGTLTNKGILVGSDAVSGSTLIELQRFGDARKFPARVKFVDHEANLALLEPDDAAFLVGMKPMLIGGKIPVNTQVSIVKERDLFQVIQTPARLIGVDVQSGGKSTYQMVEYKFEVQRTGLGYSEPVVHQGRLVALAIMQSEKAVQAVPAPVIEHFLEDASSKHYRGFPTAGFEAKPLVEPNYRKILGVGGRRGGVRVVRVFDTSPFKGLLEVNDVVYRMDGKDISENGYVRDPVWGQLDLSHLVNLRFAGDTLRLDVVRAGRELSFEAVLERHDSNRYYVPFGRHDEAEPHVIFGGLIFQELSKLMMASWGERFLRVAPLPFGYIHLYLDEPRKDPGARVVVMTRVLADSFNRGYESMQNLIVSKINGQVVANLESLREAFRNHAVGRGGRDYAVITFDRAGGEVVLGYDGLEQAHQRLRTTYGIPASESLFSR